MEGLGELLDRRHRERLEAERFYQSREWCRAREEWLECLGPTPCFFCGLSFMGEKPIPHHKSQSFKDPWYIPLHGNPDVVPVHFECHQRIHEKIDESEWIAANDVTLGRMKRACKSVQGADHIRCIECRDIIVPPRTLGGENRCRGCFSEHKRGCKEVGVCWNCGWYSTGEYKGGGGLCTLCVRVVEVPRLFLLQRMFREGLLDGGVEREMYSKEGL